VRDTIGEDIAERCRRSGITNLSSSERAALHAYLGTLPPRDVVREGFGTADRASERVVDELWLALGREPNRAEYRALAAMFREAAKRCT
jgi:hypothetical protein